MSNLDEQHEKMKNGLAAEIGAKGGKAKKGSRHLSTLIREIGENIDWDKTTLKNKDQMRQLYGNNGWKAIVYVAMTKSMAGDPQAMRWLADNGYGKHIDITSGNEPIKAVQVVDLGALNADKHEAEPDSTSDKD